jgi:hypothetical protein
MHGEGMPNMANPYIIICFEQFTTNEGAVEL